MPSDHERLSLLRLRATLADTLCLIDEGLPGAARITLPSALDLDRAASPAGHTAAFTSPWWRDAYYSGAARELFTACCFGQGQLGRVLNVPAY